jgi:hypothetical protein
MFSDHEVGAVPCPLDTQCGRAAVVTPMVEAAIDGHVP